MTPVNVSRMLDSAADASTASNMNYSHGASIYKKGGKKVACGCNHSRSKHGNFYTSSTHAEMDAINNFRSLVLRGKNLHSLQ